MNLIMISQKKSIKNELNRQRISLETISTTLKKLKDQISTMKSTIINQINWNIEITRKTLIKELVIAFLPLFNSRIENKINSNQ